MNYKHDKAKVIEKGMNLFWVHGYHNLGINTICNETGMTKGAFYNSFQSKEKFLIATLNNYGDMIETHLKNQLENKNLSAFEKIIKLYKSMLIAQKKNNYKGCFVNNIMSELGSLNDSISEISGIQFNRFVKAIEPTVKQAQLNDMLIDTIDSYKLSEIIHTTFFGFLTRSKSTKKPSHLLMTSFLNTLKK